MHYLLIRAVFFCEFTIAATGKIYIGNKQEIAESRIPELNTYMKVTI